MVEFPKMLYRPQPTPNPEMGGLKLETLIVSSAPDQAEAVRQGWSPTLAAANEQVKKIERRNAKRLKFREAFAHPVLGVAGTIVLALCIAFLTKLFGWN